MSSQFKKGDIVLAKIGGFPWWPAIVASIRFEKETRILVNFIGDRSHAELPVNKIESYKDNSPDLTKIKNKSLYRSIKIANMILKGDITYEQHFQLIKENKFNIEYTESNISFSDDSSLKRKLIKRKNTKSFDNTENKVKSVQTNEEINLPNSPDKTNDESLTITSSNNTKIQKINPFIKIINDFYLNKINLTSTAQERVIIESLTLAHKEFIQIELNEGIYLLINNLVEILHSYVGHKNSEISSKSSEILVLIQQKIISDLFEKSIFSHNSVCVNSSEFSDIKEKISEYITNREKNFLGRKSEKKIKQIVNRYNLKRRERRKEIRDKIDENTIIIKSSLIEEVTLPHKEVNSMNNNVHNSNQQTKETLSKLVLKESLQIRKELDEKKLFTATLNNNQLINLFSEILIFNDQTNFNDVSLNNAVTDCFSAMQTNFHYNNYNLFDKKKFFTRKGICIQLRKVIKKILPGISDENSIKLTKIIEHKGTKIDPNINEGYKNFINNFFNKIKFCLNFNQRDV